MNEDDLAIKAKFFRGFADSTRLSILFTLIDGGKTVSEIVKITHQSQPNISNHLRCLLDCGLVENKRKGKNIYYSLRNPQTKELLKLSEEVISRVYSHVAACLRYK